MYNNTKSLSDELMERRAGVIAQAREIAQRGVDARRDLTVAEQNDFDALVADADKMEQRAREIHEGELRAHEGPKARTITSGCPSLLVSPGNIAKHAEALREGRTFSATEERAFVTADGTTNFIGVPQAWAQTAAREPQHLIRFAGIPVETLTGTHAVMPSFTLPSSAVGVAESAPHTEYDDVTAVQLAALRYGRWTGVTAAVSAFVNLSGFSNGHAIAIARDLDRLAVTDIEAAAGTGGDKPTDIAHGVREMLMALSANTMRQTDELVLIGSPSAIALLQDVQPANGPDAGSVTTRFAGTRLYASAAATPGKLTAFDPQSFLCFMGGLQSATSIDPRDGSTAFGSWLHSTGLGQGLTGSALALTVA